MNGLQKILASKAKATSTSTSPAGGLFPSVSHTTVPHVRNDVVPGVPCWLTKHAGINYMPVHCV